ncbi:MAG: tripartite tricarboxylate transporter substrate binding protein [Betaproteobacteria bacterium]|nr:tripartite tricarboxylate transporter substrate binding protein [Betaproteobacteria bacterium]
MKSHFISVLTWALVGAWPLQVLSQSGFPDRNLRLVVPQTAGGPSDVLGRMIAQKLSDTLGKAVVIDNKPGAGGNIGSDIIAKSKPDGHTILINIAGILAINESLYKTMPFNSGKDLEGLGKIASSNMILVAHPSFAPNTIRELISFVKSKPAGTFSYGSAGTGSPQHIGGELLNTKAGIKLNHIPYKGAVPALTDLLGGQIPLAIVGLPAALPHVKTGKLKAIAIFGRNRSAHAPDVATFVETGFAEIEMELVYGLFVATGTPRPIINKLNQELLGILRTADVKEKLLSNGFELVDSSPKELDDYLKSEIEKWRPIVRDSGAVAD